MSKLDNLRLGDVLLAKDYKWFSTDDCFIYKITGRSYSRTVISLINFKTHWAGDYNFRNPHDFFVNNNITRNLNKLKHLNLYLYIFLGVDNGI
jgi:hypothetical protein